MQTHRRLGKPSTKINCNHQESWGELGIRLWLKRMPLFSSLLWCVVDMTKAPLKRTLISTNIHIKKMKLPSNSHNNTTFVQEPFCFYMPVGLEAVFTVLSLSLYRHCVFTELVDLYVVCKGNLCCKSNIVFTDQGILLYYFIHIIFYKLLPRYIFFVWFYIVSSLLLPNRICHVDTYLSFASFGCSKWKFLVVCLLMVWLQLLCLSPLSLIFTGVFLD